MDTRKRAIISYYLLMSQAYLLNINKINKRRRWWVREIFKKREQFGDASNLVKEISLNDSDHFYNYTRMSYEQFSLLLSMVEPSLSKTSIRTPISERDRLLVTLRFLATGMSYCSLSYAFRMGKSTIHNIIKETTAVIWLMLNEKYIPKPNREQLREIAKQFYIKTGMPNCIGAIDGKHCIIQAPAHSGTLYHNYKKTFSIVLMAVCDADFNYTYVNIGAYGSESDGGILRRSDFGQNLLNGSLDLPEDVELPNSNIRFPHYLVGDEAFPLKRNLLRPYGGRSLSTENQNFNKCLSRARRVIENTFGIMANKFRIYHTVIFADPKLAKAIVRSTVVLHNFIRKTRIPVNTPIDSEGTSNDEDVGNWRHCDEKMGSNHPSHEALALRDILANYLNIYVGE